jgi:hypothetical protein
VLYYLVTLNIKSMKHVALGVLLCLICAGIGFAGYYFGHQKGFSAGSDEGYVQGYKEGKTPTAEDIQVQNRKDSIVKDIFTISDRYMQIADLCEQKYQYGLSGDLNSALQIKGQITAIENEINEIFSSYNISGDEEYNAVFQ